MIISAFDRVENIVGKGENADYQHFLFSNNVLKRLLCQTCRKVSLRGNGLIFVRYFCQKSHELPSFVIGDGEGTALRGFEIYQKLSQIVTSIKKTT